MAAKMDALIKEINKEFKENLITVGLPKYDYDRIPFTSPRLNYMTYGGLPVGKLVEFFGEEHGGKTTSALDSVANFQQKEKARAEADSSYEPRSAIWADMENTLDAVWATKLGVDLSTLYILKPTNQGAETVFEQLLRMIDTGEIGLVVIDSLGVMVSNQAMEKEVGEKTYGGISMGLTDFSSKAEMLCNKYDCTIIGINQQRADMNSMYGGTKTTGGYAWRHNCSVRLEFKMGKYIDEKGNDLTRQAENPAGNYVLVTMKKNKTCPPDRRTGYYTINYKQGIDYLKDLVEVAIKYGVVDKAGAWFAILNPETGEQLAKLQGVSKVYEYLEAEENRDALVMIENYVESKIQGGTDETL